MTDNQNKGQVSLIQNVHNKVEKARREATQAELEKLYREYLKAKAVADGIFAKIVETTGEFDSEEAVRKVLGH